MRQKGQVTLFIIIAVLVIAAALFSYFFFIKKPTIAPKVQPVETYFVDCISEHVKEATKIAGMQAGYIELPEFEPGSDYLPFSSRFNFLGSDVPYWFYVSGNNIFKEQKPELWEIEKQFSDYLNTKVKECEFDFFTEQGYEINFEGEPKTEVKIKADSIESVVVWPLTITYGDATSKINEHKAVVKTHFGRLYDDAKAIYEAEQEQLFLENYAMDVLRLYAPVTGIEISCAPKTWVVSSVRDELDNALEGNIAAIKVKGSYYDLGSERKYFEVDIGRNIDETVYFLYSKNIPHVFSVWPSENNLMKAEPVGMQPGLGILGSLGFCYVPYHFVYDLKFPVLIQIMDGDEFFQFPVVVVIDKNSVRNVTTSETEELVFDVCQYKNQEVSIFTYDENLRPIEADIGYKCFNQVCDI